MTLFFFLPLSSEADNLALSSEFRIPEILGGLGHRILNEITRLLVSTMIRYLFPLIKSLLIASVWESADEIRSLHVCHLVIPGVPITEIITG